MFCHGNTNCTLTKRFYRVYFAEDVTHVTKHVLEFIVFFFILNTKSVTRFEEGYNTFVVRFIQIFPQFNGLGSRKYHHVKITW